MKAILGLCVAACAAWTAPAWSAQTLRYVALVDGGKQAGQQSVSVGDDGITRVEYVFKDNGRGPFIRQRPGELSQAYAALAEHLPPDVQRGLRTAEFDIPDDATAALYNRSYEKRVAFVGRLYRAGVPLVAGTDATPGFTLQREIELYVQAGLTPAQALQVATWNGAKYSRTLDSRGSIAPGKRADLILVDGDPTRDIGDLRKVALVVKQGTAYYPSEVYAALGIEPFAAPARIATVED